jgi:hypothetical protein
MIASVRRRDAALDSTTVCERSKFLEEVVHRMLNQTDQFVFHLKALSGVPPRKSKASIAGPARQRGVP